MRKVAFDGSLPHQLHTIMRSAAVQRYHTENTIKQQSVGEHTYGVMWIVMLLTDGVASALLLKAALMHDTPEHVTGDIPAPTKNRLNNREELRQWEEELMLKLGYVPAELGLKPSEALVLKMADSLEGALWCLRELQRGNQHIRYCLDNYLEWVCSMLSNPAAAVVGPGALERATAIFQFITREYEHEQKRR